MRLLTVVFVGARRSFYFLFLPSYWTEGRSRDSNVEDAEHDAETGSTTNRDGVVVEGLTVRFGDFEAVKGVSLSLSRGQVTALLGTTSC